MNFPLFARVRQTRIMPKLDDPVATVRQGIEQSRIRERVRPGGRIALGVGSRGIQGIAAMARSAVDTLRDLGFAPFIVAAMGSHGEAKADGQRALLAEYGVTEDLMGVEIRTEMETVQLGINPVGLPIYFDRNAYQADGIVLINRIKPHTDFRGDYESGILKMLTIGLGKIEGASQVHRLGLRGMKEVLPAVGTFLLKNTKFALGLAVLENAADQTAEIVPLEPDQVLDQEPQLLAKARDLMGRLPFDQIDVLVVGEIGKNYSGAGMDPNVIGRLLIETQPDFDRPKITRIVALDASEESHGNIVGIGFADLTTEKLVNRLNPVAFQTNVLTACFLERARVPITMPNDQAAIASALDTCWRINPQDARAVIIPNTLEVAELWVSTALLDEVHQHPELELASEPTPIPFDTSGNLNQTQLFPHCVRALRQH